MLSGHYCTTICVCLETILETIPHFFIDCTFLRTLIPALKNFSNRFFRLAQTKTDRRYFTGISIVNIPLLINPYEESFDAAGNRDGDI